MWCQGLVSAAPIAAQKPLRTAAETAVAWLAKDGGAALAAVAEQEEEKVLAVAGNCCAAALLPEGGALEPVRATNTMLCTCASI